MEDTEFDVLVIGTSLTESIVAAALSKAGIKVLHVDSSAEYGGRDASLSLKDFVEFVARPPAQLHISKLSNPIRIPEHLLTRSRDYAISLSPSVLPATGPLITALVQSGVARYGAFKLLDAVGIYGADGRVETIPASKEDVFKSKALSLIEKRRLMKFLMFASGDFESSDTLRGKEGIGFSEFLRGPEFALSAELASAVAYALAHCSVEIEPTLPALSRLRRYIQSTGRYGNSPFLVGHYGGAGELSQGFCRTCAVSGGTYILGKDLKVEYSEEKKSFQISLDGIDETLSSKAIVAEPSQLPEPLSTQAHDPSKLVSRCIAIVDQPVQLVAPGPSPTEDSDDGSALIPEVDSSVLVFPPGRLHGGTAQESVTAMITGEGSMSCPTGFYVVYLSGVISHDQTPEDVLGPYLSATLNVNRGERESITPIFSLFYAHPLPSAPPASPSTSKRIVPVRPPGARLPEFGDGAAEEAERVFWDTIEAVGLRRGATSSPEDGQTEGEDIVTSFWPPLEPEDTSAVDEW